MSGIFNGKNKALTFSFDDGNIDDVRLIKILNKYGLKGTFNLNSGGLTSSKSWKYANTKDVFHINYLNSLNIYDGHEIASHSYTHPDLTKLDDETIDNEIATDKKLLEFLYNQKVEGFAYPNGTYNDNVISLLQKNRFKYARTIKPTFGFTPPKNWFEWHPSCHFLSEKVEKLAEEFINLKDETALFYIWGHSYELITEEQWSNFENLCCFLSGKDDIMYDTNINVFNCISK